METSDNSFRLTTSSTNWKRRFILIYTLLGILATLISIFMLLGGFVFAFDAPLKGNIDLLFRWAFIGEFVTSPFFFLISAWMLRKYSIQWAWFGAVPIIAYILLGIVYSVLGLS